MAASGEHVRRWDFGLRVDRLQVGGELARDAQPLGPVVRLRVRWLSRPADRQLAAEGRRAGGLEMGDELAQQPLLALKLEPQRAAQP